MSRSLKPSISTQIPLGRETDSGLLDLYRRHGRSSTSFLTLYEGYRHFSPPGASERGVIAYVETRWAWIGAGDPIAELSCWPVILSEFQKAAGARGKSALLLPVSEAAARVAVASGYRSYPIGAEPWHDLVASGGELRVAHEVNPARQLRARGAKVESFEPDAITPAESLELQDVSQEWLESRKTDPLGFLNRLEPWALAEHKRYYWVRHQGRILGFLAAVPVWGAQSWYLVDLIRRPVAPLGATELLVIEAMRDLQKRGALRVTLGFSPLSRLEEAPLLEPKSSRFSLNACRWVFENGSLFYNFRSLYDYKAKFHPDAWEPQYLVTSPKGLGLRESWALGEALYPKGMLACTLGFAARTVARLRIFAWLSSRISRELVLRPAPRSVIEFLQRARSTIFIGLLSIFLFLGSTDKNGVIREPMLMHYGLTYDRLVHHPFSYVTVRSILVCPALYLSPVHLLLGLVALLLVVVPLETGVGSVLALSTFLIGSYATWPIVALLDFLVLSWLFPGFHLEVAGVHRVGPSLGIAACLGAGMYLLARSGKKGLIVLAATALVLCFAVPQYCLSHFLSVALGYAWLSALLPKKDPLFAMDPTDPN